MNTAKQRLALITACNNRDGATRATLRDIGRNLGLSDHEVAGDLAWLIYKGYICRDRRHREGPVESRYHCTALGQNVDPDALIRQCKEAP